MTQPLYHRDRFIQLKQAARGSAADLLAWRSRPAPSPDSRIRQAQLEVDAVYQELMVRLSERYFALLGAADNNWKRRASASRLASSR